MDLKVSEKAVREAAKKLSNWGKWGKDDRIGTLNYVTGKEIVAASKLVKKGRVFGMGIPLDQNGPQQKAWGGRYQSHPPDDRDRHRCRRRPLRQGYEAPLFR